MKQIYIRKMRFEEARYKLEREMQEAFMEGETLVEIVHGIGEGILRKMAIDYIQASDYLRIVEVSQFINTNPGSTKVEILGPDKQTLKRYKQ